MNVLLTSAGRRPYLARWFREALSVNRVHGEVIVADSDPLSPATAEADRFLQAPSVTAVEYDGWLASAIAKHGVSLAISVNDFELSRWAHIADRSGGSLKELITLSPRMHRSVEDKVLMASVLSQSGIPVPETMVITDIPHDQLTEGGYIVKGRYGSGSRGLAVVTGLTLEAHIAKVATQVTDPHGVAPQHPEAARDLLVLQPQIQGQEFGLDVVNDLEGNFVTVLARRKLGMRGGETDRAITVDPAPFRELGRSLSRILAHRGSTDVDVIVDDQQTCWVIDVNPRFGGGYPFSHLAGANIPAAYIAWASGYEAQEAWLHANLGVVSAKFVDAVAVPLNHQTSA